MGDLGRHLFIENVLLPLPNWWWAFEFPVEISWSQITSGFHYEICSRTLRSLRHMWAVTGWCPTEQLQHRQPPRPHSTPSTAWRPTTRIWPSQPPLPTSLPPATSTTTTTTIPATTITCSTARGLTCWTTHQVGQIILWLYSGNNFSPFV